MMHEDMRFIIRLLFAVLFISLLSAGVGMKLQKKATDRWYAEHQEPHCGPFGITSAMKVGDIYFCAASSQWKQGPSHVEIIDFRVDECALPKGCNSETIPDSDVDVIRSSSEEPGVIFRKKGKYRCAPGVDWCWPINDENFFREGPMPKVDNKPSIICDCPGDGIKIGPREKVDMTK